MLTLDQVKLLENKVESLIEMVKTLYEERDVLRDSLQKKDKKIEELSAKVDTYEAEQAKIEERVVHALNQLDVFQNSVASAKAILSQADASGASNEVIQDASGQQNQDEHKTETSDIPTPSKDENISQENSSSVNQDLQADQQTSNAISTEENKKEESEEDSDRQMDIF